MGHLTSSIENDILRPTYFDKILPKTGALPVFVMTSSVKRELDLTRYHYFNIKGKVASAFSCRGDFLTTNLSMFLTEEKAP